MALYTDRAHWAVHTPVAGGGADRRRPHPGRPRPGPARASSTSWATRPRPRGPQRARQSHPARPPRQRAARGRHHHGRRRQPLPARALPCRPSMPSSAAPPTDPASAFVPLGRVDLEQILCVEAGARRRPRQRRHRRRRRPATRQAARPPHLRGAPGARPPPSRWPPLRLVRRPLLRPLRPPRPPLRAA